METQKQLDSKVSEIMNDKEKATEIVKKYWNALDEVDTLSRKVSKLERQLKIK